MSGLVPVEVYGLKVPAGGLAVQADGDIDVPATFRITMAAIDPTAAFESDGPARSTLKLIKIRSPELDDDEDDDDDEEYDEDDIRAIESRLGLAEDDDDEDESSDEEANGGPSDPARSRKARAQALAKEILEGGDESMDDELPNGVNGKAKKGKERALDDDEDDDEEDEDEDIQEYVICTLDPEKNYQQTLDITLNNETELCYFQVTGSHAVYLTGNFVIPPNEEEDEDEEDYSDDDDMEDMLLGDGLDEELSDEDDELDALDDPRITEVASEDDEAPPLVEVKKGKNKRKADESDVDVSMDSILEKVLKPEAATNGTADDKLSKKQKKKLKNNAGDAVPATAAPAAEAKVTPSKADKKAAAAAAADTPNSNGKKVQFAKELEQGPTGTTKGLGVKVVEGVTLDDKKLGAGPQAKNGNKVELRYIGKLTNGKQFDANKKGKPFSFTLGKGEVVKGMDIGIRGMAAGGERRITMPARLGYGSKGAGKDIPPNSDLIFEVKLLAIR